jgi:LysM repeat protein
MLTFVVPPGDTLSQIAQQFGLGDNYQAIADANGISNPNLIYAGQRLVIPSSGSYTTWTPPQQVQQQAQPAYQPPQQPAPQPTYQPSNPQPVQQQSQSSGSGTSAPGGVSIPGMPQGLANCIWQRESTSGTNPAADGNQFGIIPASGHDVAGDSVQQQEQVAGQIYAQSGGQAWAADGCPGT